MSTSEEEFLHNICKTVGHDLTEPNFCLRCKRHTMPELRSAATKNFQLYWDETNRKVSMTYMGYTMSLDRSEVATLARLLKSKYDD